jgi:rhodanese-related sulfurtransferase
MLYDSLFEKLLKLPDATRVYPAHGAGSLCGRNMRAERSSTIGNERLTNAALQAANRDEFVRQVTANLPARPGYFSQDAEINRAGAVPLGELPAPKEIGPAELEKLLKQGVIGLDVRPTDQFAESHIPGSVNIALSGQFASWAATLFGLGSRPILIAETEQQYAEARTRLARVGIEDLDGRLTGGVKAWIDAGLPVERLEQMTVQQLEEKRRTSNLNVLDVRREPEWESGHIAGANWWPLDNFRVSPPEIEQSTDVAVHCKGGYRSMIACSLLQRAGYKNVINVVGGFDAWLQEKLPVETGVGASV